MHYHYVYTVLLRRAHNVILSVSEITHTDMTFVCQVNNTHHSSIAKVVNISHSTISWSKTASVIVLR